MKKSDYEIALEVIRGSWGAGDDRYNLLLNAGYDPVAIQNMVNRIMAGQIPANDTKKAALSIDVNLNKYDSIILNFKV